MHRGKFFFFSPRCAPSPPPVPRSAAQRERGNAPTPLAAVAWRRLTVGGGTVLGCRRRRAGQVRRGRRGWERRRVPWLKQIQ